jgi:hypothetical protein
MPTSKGKFLQDAFLMGQWLNLLFNEVIK